MLEAINDRSKVQLTYLKDIHNMVEDMYLGDFEPPTPPEPPPGPELGRPTALVIVTADKCHLRFVDHLDGAGKAVWGSYPKGSDNPKRDRYIVIFDGRVEVYMDGKIRWGKYKGAAKGTGGNHGWEVVPGQIFNGHFVTGDPKLYILCKDAKRI
jgi:hypothetical protein